MPASRTIDKNNKLSHAQDYNFLRREGIDLIQKLSGEIWTDYNTHDPGITLLEAICYALTDLGYRTAFDIQDILAPEKLSFNTWEKVFLTAREILPCNPSTLIDYRKLIIDTKGVRNAWIEKSDDYEILMYLQQTKSKESAESKYSLTYDPKKGEEVLRLRGLYKVFVEYEDYVIDEKKEDEVAEVIRKKLQFHRNLCEDFVSVSSIEYEYFPIEALIQVSEGTDIAMITAHIYKVIYDFFSPPITFYTLEQMLEKNSTAEEIFKGPALNYGFIDTNELVKSERYKDIHLSDIIRLMSGIQGIIAVKKFSFGQSQSPFSNFNEWVNNVKDKQKIPKLDIENSVITFVRSGDRHRLDKNNQPNKEKVRAIFSFLKSGDFKSRLKGIGKDLPVPTGEFMDIADYYPFQNSLPATYGMAEQLIDDIADHLSVIKAVNELLDEKVGTNLRVVLNTLLNEAEEDNTIKKVIHDLLAEPTNETSSIEEIINRLLNDERNSALIRKIITELFGEQGTHIPLKEQINKLIENKAVNVAISDKTKILKALALSTCQKSLFQITSTEDIARLNDAYKKYQINSLNKRKQLILQLRGFLMVFEQILSDYLSQLAHTRELFSFDPLAHQTHFPEVVQGIHDMEALFIDFKKYKEDQLKLIETESSFIKRRTGILDHLLARFSESLEKYSFFMNQFLEKRAGKKLIKDKIGFLSDYVEISSYRGKGFDYTNPEQTWDTDNVEGVKKRICRLLGIERYTRRSIAPDTIYIEEVRPDDKIVRYVVILSDPDNRNNFLLKSIDYEFESEARQILNYILEYGIERHLYDTQGRKDKWTYHLKKATQEKDYEIVAYSRDFHNKDERDDALKQTLQTLTDFSDDENFHIVEHVLLRPKVGPRESIRRSSSAIGADTVDLLSVRSVPDKKTILDDKNEEVTYKFKITQVKDQTRKDRTIWKLSLVKEDDELLIVNEEFTFYKHLTRRIEHIQEFGSDEINYKSGTNADGYFNFKIMAGDRYLAESKKNYRRKEDMNEEITNLVNFFSYELAFISGQIDDDSLSYYADPYSLQISIVIPSWHKRFRSAAFKHLLEKTIYLETPSHIYAHVYWLDHKEMKEFEEAYRLWVQELANIELPDTDIVNNMIFRLNELRK